MPFADISEQRLYYRWFGKLARGRATVVFLHDGLGSTRSWKGLPGEIARRCGLNALAYDRAGYGRSCTGNTLSPGFMEREVPRLHAFLDALDLPSVHLVGHSDGASIALLYAAQDPGRVQSVGSVAAHTFVEERTVNSIRKLKQAAESGDLPGWMKRQHGRRAGSLLRSWADAWLSPAHARWDIRSQLGRIACPVLAIQGDEDEFGTLAQAASVLEGVPDAQEWILPACGHLPHIDRAEAFAARMAAFLISPHPPNKPA